MREVLPCIPAIGLLASSRAGRSRDASMPAMPLHQKPADEVNKTVGQSHAPATGDPGLQCSV